MKAQYLKMFIVPVILCILFGCGQDRISPKRSKESEPVLSSSGYNLPSSKGIADTKKMLKPGDIILRTGNDLISSLFAQLNMRDKTYSHCGIVFSENNQWVVYHSIGGEDNPDEKLRKDLLETFISSDHNLGYGVCRYNIGHNQQIQLHRTVDSFYSAGTPFDMQFDLQSDDRLYCAELVYKAFQKSLNNDTFFTTTTHRGFTYISTDNIFVNNKAQILCHIVY